MKLLSVSLALGSLASLASTASAKQTDSTNWGKSTTCSGCSFWITVDPAKAIGVPVHQSGRCITEMLREKELQWPTAKWDYAVHGKLEVKKENNTGNLHLEGFLNLNGLKPGYPKNLDGGFSVQDYVCANSVKASVDCLPASCSKGVREVIGFVMDPPGHVDKPDNQ